ncbi:MAG: maleylacetate reductase [Sneathiella sp.]
MQQQFELTTSPSKIIFGDGAMHQTATIVKGLGCARALILSTPQQEDLAKQIQDDIGKLAVGIYTNATMHTPFNVTEDALAQFNDFDADVTIAVGGGSTTGLGKALALRTGKPQIVIPTTYAGSEVTPILGQTENGIKTTVKDANILPDVVIYDPLLTYGLPDSMTVTSALNALAHAAEALYAKDRNPISTLMAKEGIKALIEALPVIKQDPHNSKGRQKALYGAWLCGSVLGSVGMSLHHKLCHTLGGAFDLPHADTHAILLPHVIAFNEVSVPDLLKPISDVLEVDYAGVGLYEYSKSISAPTALKDVGMLESGIGRAATLAVANPYWNPREFNKQQIQKIIENAFHGVTPEGQNG